MSSLVAKARLQRTSSRGLEDAEGPQTGSGAIVRVRDSRRPLSPPEVAFHFRYRVGDTVAVGQTWGIVREAVASVANRVAQYIIEQPGELPSLHDEGEVRPRRRTGGS